MAVAFSNLRCRAASGALAAAEAFGAGTAAVVSPIRAIGIDGRDYELPVAGEQDSHSNRLKHALDDIRYGRSADIYEWNYFV